MRGRRSRILPLLGIVLLLGAHSRADAQRGGDGYLFGRPIAILSIRGGVDRPLVNSGVFQFFTDNLLLSQRQFMSGTWTAEIAVPIGDRFDVSLSGGRSLVSTGSEFRRFIDNNDQPIEQTTTLDRIPVSLSVRYFLRPRGESISSLAWIPNRLSPYVGAGAGAMWSRLEQRGDFVDVDTRNIFSDEFVSDDQSVLGLVFAGAELRVTPRLALVGEVRYQQSKARLDSDFQNFPRADLSGVSLTTGLSFRL
jgi:hypothetical protein